jgi:glycosyltransferase involved in cell wall biosynthesis
MSVYNGAARLPATLESIRRQTMDDYELIAVDDGSTDATPSILASAALDDPRIRVVTQPNRGLTLALIRGCAEARAPVIARHDCGDLSAPERFEKQLALLRDDVGLVSCFTRFVGPGGEHLFDAKAAGGEEIRESLLRDDVRSIRGLSHHGTAMFGRDDYLHAGGYREAFRFAQDLDLWIRIARHRRIAIVPEILYEASFDSGTISALRRDDQVALAKIAIAVRDGGDAAELLERARAIGAASHKPTRRQEAQVLYFIASCLRRNADRRYRRYAREALRRDPLLLRAWLLFLR